MRFIGIVAILGLFIVITTVVFINVERTISVKSDITYDQAVKLLHAGEVKTVGQTHGRLVVLDLKNGTTIKTYEQQIDMIWHDYNGCGDPCRDTVFWTE